VTQPDFELHEIAAEGLMAIDVIGHARNVAHYQCDKQTDE